MTFEDIEKTVQNAQTLSDLFRLWQKAHEFDPNWEATFPRSKESGAVEAFKTSFCIDGVSSLYGKYSGGDKADVLFILKESNIGQDELRKAGTTHPFWFNEEPTHSTREKYAKRFKAVLERYEPEWDVKAPIGYMNLNKRGGAGYTEAKRLTTYVTEYQRFIMKEIELMSPSVIFLCGCENSFHSITDSCMSQVTSDGMPMIISLYHPSYPRFDDCLARVPVKQL